MVHKKGNEKRSRIVDPWVGGEERKQRNQVIGDSQHGRAMNADVWYSGSIARRAIENRIAIVQQQNKT